MKTILHRYPNGMVESVFSEEICACNQYKKLNGLESCIRCDKRERLPNFKKEKKKDSNLKK